MPPEELPSPLPSRGAPPNGGRVAIALGCWLFSGIALLMSLMMVVGFSIASLFTKPLSEVLWRWDFYLGIAMAYAWLALGVMTGAWVGDRQAAWHWPLLGGLAGLICVAVFFLAIPLYFPCVFLGLYLCYFHLVGHAQRKDLRHPADEGPQR